MRTLASYPPTHVQLLLQGSRSPLEIRYEKPEELQEARRTRLELYQVRALLRSSKHPYAPHTERVMITLRDAEDHDVSKKPGPPPYILKIAPRGSALADRLQQQGITLPELAIPSDAPALVQPRPRPLPKL